LPRQILSVGELTIYLQSKLETDPTLQGIWVEGELSNFMRHSSGHMYFTIKDSTARLKCVMFKGHNLRLRFRPTDGMAVMAHGSITIYPKSGEYQLYIDAMEPSGLGSLFLAYEQLKEKLTVEGLFDNSRKRPIPEMPAKVALITSPTGAAVRDMIKVLRRRRTDVDIIIIPAQVQGAGAAESLAKAVRLLGMVGADSAIIGRGGGSIEELWAFNEEVLVREVASAPIPIISAVGHETDFTLTDLAADLRAPTPSAAAELATADGAQFCRHLLQLDNRMTRTLAKRIEQMRREVQRLETSAVLSRPERFLGGRRQEIDQLSVRMGRAMLIALENRKSQFNGAIGRLEALSPLGTLRRGYSICLNQQEQLVRKASEVHRGDAVKVILASGRLACLVEEVEDAGDAEDI
jgi:exodeoxyribonuclease VII large subunit